MSTHESETTFISSNFASAQEAPDISLSEDTVVVATGNPHKVLEIEAIMSEAMPKKQFIALKDLGDFPDPVEDGDTFTKNARIKAQAALDETGAAIAIADDSGLVVDALNGEPGIYSARYAGCHGDDAANNKKLLKNLESVPQEKRSARFHASIVMLFADGTEFVGEGDCEGFVGFEERGENGFGYDPLFYPDDTPGKSMAEISTEEKNHISHRYRALKELSAKVLSSES